jgi:hypothetical protein
VPSSQPGIHWRGAIKNVLVEFANNSQQMKVYPGEIIWLHQYGASGMVDSLPVPSTLSSPVSPASSARQRNLYLVMDGSVQIYLSSSPPVLTPNDMSKSTESLHEKLRNSNGSLRKRFRKPSFSDFNRANYLHDEGREWPNFAAADPYEGDFLLND